MKDETLNQIFIQTNNSISNIALLQNNQLIEYHNDDINSNYSVGDIFIGKVKKVMIGLNAAFVDIGYHKDAFLHYHDLGLYVTYLINMFNSFNKKNGYSNDVLHRMKFQTSIDKNGSIKDILNVGQNLLVQIVKEPIASKGPRLSTMISIPGRYMILMPFNNKICISKRIINDKERNRLKSIFMKLLPNNFGIIIRTVSENKNYIDLEKELLSLLKKWELCIKKIYNKSYRFKAMKDNNRISIVLREILNPNFESIYVDNNVIYDQVTEYVNTISPKQKNIVKLYKEDISLFDKFGINKQIKSLFGVYVYMIGGAYLVIEHTEAMHVIDVNSGYSNNIAQEENALKVNLEATKEIARQIRLRDMGGIIVVDFIDMNKYDNRKIIFDTLKCNMINDKAKHTILPLSKFGIIQITRQRIRPIKNISTNEYCPSCKGSGKIEPSILLIDEIYNKLFFIFSQKKYYNIAIHVHPYIKSYITYGLFSIRLKWTLKFKSIIYIKDSYDYYITEYHIYDMNSNKKILL
ncbi:MAG: Rne/Rng family ribonuclease [Bacteroides sp.]|nr:MAG: Rne/Rng family ribonuclease [Bacteroides sp.]